MLLALTASCGQMPALAKSQTAAAGGSLTPPIPAVSTPLHCRAASDPPHSDRIPYLELSELWNALLDEEPNFSEELIVSNAKERKKTKNTYSAELGETLHEMSRIMRPNGFLVLVFNARSADDWEGLTQHMGTVNGNNPLKCAGRFPVYYSAGSVVQDNREGGLKHDFAMVFTKANCDKAIMSVQLHKLHRIPGWEGVGDIKQCGK